MTEPRALPVDLGIEIETALAHAPCWVVHAAHRDGRPVIACELLPELFAAGRRPDRLAGPIVRGVRPAAPRAVDPARADPLETLGEGFGETFRRLHSDAAADHALAPADAFQFSMRTETYWLIYDLPADALTRAPSQVLQRTPLATVADNLARSLGLLHEAGVWHLDLCPQAIVGDGRIFLPAPALRDAGLDEGLLLARPLYSPPELYDASRRSQVGPWTDIYMASATLYALATGETPLPMAGRPRDPAAFREQIIDALSGLPEHRGLADAVAAGLAMRIGERPQTAADWRGMMDLPDPVVAAPVAVATEPATSPEFPAEPVPDEPAEAIAEPDAPPPAVPATEPEPAPPPPPEAPVIAAALAPPVEASALAARPGSEPQVAPPPPVAGRSRAPVDSGQPIVPPVQTDVDVVDSPKKSGGRPGRVVLMIGAVMALAAAAYFAPQVGEVLEGFAKEKPPVVAPPPTKPPPPVQKAAPPSPPAPVLVNGVTEVPAESPAKPTLDQLAGTWRIGEDGSCNVEVKAFADGLSVKISGLEFSHKVVSEIDGGWRTRMNGDASGRFEIHADDADSLEMIPDKGTKATWTRCKSEAAQ